MLIHGAMCHGGVERFRRGQHAGMARLRGRLVWRGHRRVGEEPAGGCRGAGDFRWAHNVLAGGATGCLAWILAFVAWLIVSVVATG